MVGACVKIYLQPGGMNRPVGIFWVVIFHKQWGPASQHAKPFQGMLAPHWLQFQIRNCTLE